ncbi:unnamed protein product, partial [Prorocentrum cordatum]
ECSLALSARWHWGSQCGYCAKCRARMATLRFEQETKEEIEETRVKVIAKKGRALEKSRKQWLEAQDRIPQHMARPILAGPDSKIKFEESDPVRLKVAAMRSAAVAVPATAVKPFSPKLPTAMSANAEAIDEMETVMQQDRQERARQMAALIEA